MRQSFRSAAPLEPGGGRVARDPVGRIGAGCALTFDASQWDPEVVANTTFDFASQGSGTLKYFPFINPEWLDCPNVTGYTEGDMLEIAGQGSAQRFQVRDGRIVANARAA